MKDIDEKVLDSRTEAILVLDDNSRFLDSVRTNLHKGGFANILLAIDFTTAEALLATKPEIALVDINLGEEQRTGIDFIKKVVNESPQTIPVVLSANRTQECFFNAARAGAVDFMVKGAHVNLCVEVTRLLNKKRGVAYDADIPPQISDLAYLRSFGLTRRELQVLTEFSTDFPKLSTLAARIDQAPVQLRKIFSRIYVKLEIPNLHQLVRTLTICELFNKQS